MPSADVYRLQDILYSAYGSNAQILDNTGALEHGMYNLLGETYVLDIDEWDAIDVYDWQLWLLPAAEAPIDA